MFDPLARPGQPLDDARVGDEDDAGLDAHEAVCQDDCLVQGIVTLPRKVRAVTRCMSVPISAYVRFPVICSKKLRLLLSHCSLSMLSK